jgi:hypothetical protein
VRRPGVRRLGGGEWQEEHGADRPRDAGAGLGDGHLARLGAYEGGVVHIEEGESSLIKVTVPESGVSEGLALGAPVALPGLVARPWESVFNGQKRHGIAFRAAAVTPAAFPATGTEAAA